jgi:hypothetical protein
MVIFDRIEFNLKRCIVYMPIEIDFVGPKIVDIICGYYKGRNNKRTSCIRYFYGLRFLKKM